MVIKPRVKGFICTTAHPDGCARNVLEQIQYIRQQPAIESKPLKVLVIGSSTGYGLAARITAAFGCQAATIGVFFEKPASGKRTASAGWYNTAAFQAEAEAAGLYSRNINADAFAHDTKQQVVDTIKADLGSVDLVIYSLASPRRTDPDTGITFTSTLKPIDSAVTQTGLDTDKERIKSFTLEPATQQEIDDTVKVMGGEDWSLWLGALNAGGVLSPQAQTLSFTYVGEAITRKIYWDGTIGAAKKHLDQTAAQLREDGIDARVAVLKAVVTQSSAAIPVMPLYLSLLFRVMKADTSHEGCIEQLYRLFTECMLNPAPRLDEAGRYRVDDKEVTPAVQAQVADLWPQITTENLHTETDFEGFRAEFMRLFGFGVEGVDYNADIDPERPIHQLITSD